jgi:hypothetical protein
LVSIGDDAPSKFAAPPLPDAALVVKTILFNTSDEFTTFNAPPKLKLLLSEFPFVTVKPSRMVALPSLHPSQHALNFRRCL